MKRVRVVIAVMICAVLALSVTGPAAAQAAEAPAKVVTYLSSQEGSSEVSFEVTGLKLSEQIKIGQVKSSDTSMATIESIYGRYYFDSTRVKNNYCRITVNAKKAGTVNISYNVGKTKKTTKVQIKKYENPVKKITLSGVNGGKDFASMTDKQSFVYGEWDEETMTNVSPFTVEAVDDPVLHIEPAKGWSITDVYANLDNNTSENYYKYAGKKYKGAQDFKLYKITEDTNSLSVTFVNDKDGGTINVNYSLKSW